MKNVLTIIGSVFSVITVIIAVLYINDVKGIELAYCMFSMIISMLLFNVSRVIGKR